MKKHIIITIIIGIISAFIIYKLTYQEQMNILVLGDSLSLGMTAYNVEGYSYNDYLKDYFEENSILREYIPNFSSIDETTNSMLLKITNNSKLKSSNLTIQQAISKAKIITVHLGMDELNNKQIIKTKQIDNYLNNMEKIIKQIRFFNQKQIFIISLYQTNKISLEQVEIINKALNQIAIENNCTFINISNIINKKEYYFNPKNYHLNYKGHKYISEQIINKLQ